jgi:uncharacterized protein (TIGR02246 family)
MTSREIRGEALKHVSFFAFPLWESPHACDEGKESDPRLNRLVTIQRSGLQRGPRMTEDERCIRELVATWMKATKAGDLDTVLSLMADDVVFMVPGREPFGKEEFAAASQGMTDLRIEGTSEIEELKVLGDWAYLRNRLTVTMTPSGGQPMLKRAGYTLSILRKEPDGRWVLARDANLLAKQG